MCRAHRLHYESFAFDIQDSTLYLAAVGLFAPMPLISVTVAEMQQWGCLLLGSRPGVLLLLILFFMVLLSLLLLLFTTMRSENNYE